VGEVGGCDQPCSLDQLESLSLDALWNSSSGLTPNQSALQHARLQLADLSSSLESNNAHSSNPQLDQIQRALADVKERADSNTQQHGLDDSSGWSDEMSTPCEASAVVGGGQNRSPTSLMIAESVAESAQSQLAHSADLESLVQQFKNKGSERSGRLLRHVLSVMIESECYEWALLVCLMLSDVTQAISIINSVICCSSPHSLTNTAHRLIQGLTSLDEWAANNCFTYRLFLAALFPYVQVLKTVMDFSFKTQRLKKVSNSSNSGSGLLMAASLAQNTFDSEKLGYNRTNVDKGGRKESAASNSSGVSGNNDNVAAGDANSAISRRLSWWRSSKSSSSRDNTQVSQTPNDETLLEETTVEERIEWLTDSWKDVNGNVSGKSAYDTNCSSLFDTNDETELSSWADQNQTGYSSSQRCVIS